MAINLKQSILSFVSFAFIFGCTNQIENQPSVEVDKSKAQLESVFRELSTQANNTFNFASTIKPVTLKSRTKTKGFAAIEEEKIANGTASYIVSNYYPHLNSSAIGESFRKYAEITDSPNARTNEDVVAAILDTSAVFNDEQTTLIGLLNKNLSSIQNPSDARPIIEEYNQKVIASGTLSEQEKIQLLQFSALSNSLVTFVEGDGAQQIYNSISSELGITGGGSTNARTSGKCSVSWGSVWRGAVIGFTVNAVRGAIGGAIAGTFTVPGIGTVTGAVSAAMANGAVGFVEGAAAGVVGDLMGSCFKNIQSEDQVCNRYFDRFKAGEIGFLDIPRNCTDNIIINVEPNF